MPHLFGLWSGVTGRTGFAIIRVPPGHVGSGACFRQVRESSPPSSPDPSRYEALARSPRPPQMLLPRPVCVSMQSRSPRSVRAPTPGARAWTWAIRHTQAPPLRVLIGDRDSHHGARPPGGNAHPCRLPCPCLSPLHPPSSPAPRQRRLNLHIEPCLPQELGVVRVCLVVRPRLPPPVAAARAIVAHAPPRHAIHASGERTAPHARGQAMSPHIRCRFT